MKRYLFLLALLLNAVWASAQFSGSGTGTQSDPYLIFNPIQLNQIRGFLNKSDVYFKVMSNIDLTDWIADNNPTQGWQPIGTSSSPFKGVIDGGGHTISGLVINRATTEYVGFFAAINGATIKDLTIDGTVNGSHRTGGFAGNSTSSKFTNVTFNGDITAADRIGGLAGEVSGCTFSKCNYKGNISGRTNVGGIIGYSSGTSTFTSCTVDAKITASGENIGGIVGYSVDNSTVNITSCFAYGIISGSKYVGGLAGHINMHTIAESGAIMDITSANGNAGGIIGSSDMMNHWSSSITRKVVHCFCIGDIHSDGDNVGGIIGYDYGYHIGGSHTSSNLSNCYYSGNISGKNNVGGIVGYAHHSQINKCYSVGSISGNTNVGGIAGYLCETSSNYRPTITSCVAINSDVNAITSGAGRIFGKKDAGNIGQTGSQTGNLGLGTCRVVVNGVLQDVVDGEQNGTSTGRSTLKVRGTYQAIGWNFNDDWNILDTECYPYAKTQMAPPVIESGCNSGSTLVTGKSTNGGTVYLKTNGKTYSGKVTANHWEITTAPLQGGAKVEVYADDAAQIQSYIVTQDITYAGKGTQDNPYQLYTAADLAGANGNYYFKLMNDIDLTDYIAANSPTTGWTPIGKGGSVMANFDGDGHTVSGLWINSTEDYVGLFSNASGATIKNLKVIAASGKKVKGGNYTGGIIGRCYNGTIENCSFKGNVEGKNYTGGIVGSDDDSQNIKNKVNGNVTGANNVGGIAGYTGGGSITKAMYNGSVQSSAGSAYVGGIAGSSKSAISQCYAAGAVSATGTGSIAGGIVGKNEAAGSVQNSYSTSEITSGSYVGGVVGYNYGSIENCYAYGNLKSAADFGGGVVGYNDGTAATTKHSVALNTKIEISDEHGWASRVVGGIKNSAPTPDMSNYAYKEMVISINGVPMKLYDDNMNGTGKTLDVLKTQSTYEDLGWDFNIVWGMSETTGLPYLLAEISDPVPAKSISLDKKSATIEIGKDLTLVATVLPDDATKKTVTWKSSNTSVATVVDGKVTGIAPGTAQITATTTDGTSLSAVCSVTVTTAIVPASAIEMSKAFATVEIGNTLILKATVSPDNATAKTVNWTTSNANIATVENGTVTALAEGTATITATTTDGTELSAKCLVTVKEKAMVYPSTDISAYTNTLYFNDVETSTGADLTLSLNMKNAEENITAFQCDVYLPAGVNWASTIDKRGNAVLTQPVFNTTTERTDASYHTISPVTQMTDGSYRIIVYSMGKETILDLDGAVLDLPLTVSADMEAGEYNIFIKNIVMTDVNTEQTLVEKVVSKLTIPSFTPGDVNDDKMINVTDVVAVVSYMLEDVPSPFIFKAADINNDETINVTDIVGIIDIINNPTSAKKAPKRMVKKSAKSEYSLEVVPFAVATGTTSKTATLDLINPEEDITAFQCDIYLPAGIDWASTTDRRGNITYTQPTFNKAADRTDDTYHTISPITKMTDGSFRIIVYSMKKEVFLDNAGAVIDLPLVFDADLAAGVYDVKVGNMVLTKTDVTQELPDDYTFSVLVGSPEIASTTLHGDYTADAISELNTALASNTVLSAIDFTEATSVDASTKIETGNKNLLLYVNEGTSVKNTQNVVEGDECESLVLTDGYNFAAPKAFTAVSASYSRTAPATYGTTVLPFVPSTSGAEFYELTGVTPTCFEFQKVVSPVAGTPYLYRATTDNFTATNAEIAATEAGKVTASGWTMQGTYTKEVFDASDNVYAVSDDKVYCNIGTLTMNPFRAYFTGNTSSAPMNISIDGTTVIGSIENGELAIDGAAFNLAGQKVGNGYKGIVITNGRKEIRK